MKHLIFAVAMTSLALTGCKKTKTVAVQDQAPAVAMDESTQAMMKVIINGEEVEMPDLPIAQIIEMAKKKGSGNVQFEAIADMIFEDEEGNVYSMSMNGHEPHAMHWVDSEEWHGKKGNWEAHSDHHDKAIMMHKKMHMGNPHGKQHDMHKANMWVGHGDDWEACEGEWNQEEDNWLEREHEEEFEFMHKVGLYHAVGEHLSEESAMAILGVHMLRDNVEPELRIELLDGIIEATFDREPGRNAALLVAIETMMDMGEEEEAAWYMAELVISNSGHGHVPSEDEGHDEDVDHDHDHDDDWDEHDHPHPHGDHGHDH